MPTGIRALDLFAPLFRGSRQYWPPALGVGQLVLPFAIADALPKTQLWWIGFEYGGHYSQASLEHSSHELDVPANIRLVASHERDRRTAFAHSLGEIASSPEDKLVVCITDSEHRHDTTLAVHALRADRRVLTTIVIEPLQGGDGQTIDGHNRAAASAPPPEGFDGVVAFDVSLATDGHFPAIAAHSSSQYPSARHMQIVAATRTILDQPNHPASDAVKRYLTQPLRISEPFHGTPAHLTPYTEMLDEIERLVRT